MILIAQMYIIMFIGVFFYSIISDLTLQVSFKSKVNKNLYWLKNISLLDLISYRKGTVNKIVMVKSF